MCMCPCSNFNSKLLSLHWSSCRAECNKCFIKNCSIYTWTSSSPVWYILIIHSNVESGPKKIQFNIKVHYLSIRKIPKTKLKNQPQTHTHTHTHTPSPVRYVSIIHLNVESGPMMIHFNIPFKIKYSFKEILIQENHLIIH